MARRFSGSRLEKSSVKRCIQKSACKVEFPDEFTEQIIETIFDNIGTELSMGRYVKLPGFGLIAPVKTKTSLGVGAVRFVPARCLANEVRACCMPSEKTQPRFSRR